LIIPYLGTNKEFEKKANKLVVECFEKMKKGEISKEKIEEVKNKIVNIKKTNEDVLEEILSNYANKLLLGLDSTTEEIKQINKIDKKDIIKFAKKVIPDTIFTLTKEEE